MYICINCSLTSVDVRSPGGPHTENGGGIGSQRGGAGSTADTQGQGDRRLQGTGSTRLKKYVHQLIRYIVHEFIVASAIVANHPQFKETEHAPCKLLRFHSICGEGHNDMASYNVLLVVELLSS